MFHLLGLCGLVSHGGAEMKTVDIGGITMTIPTRILEKPHRTVTNDGRSIVLYVTDRGVYTIQQLSKVLQIPTNTIYYRIIRGWQNKHVFDAGRQIKIARDPLERPLPVHDCDFMKLSNKPRNRNLSNIKIGT
jgi:hypothetical protein